MYEIFKTKTVKINVTKFYINFVFNEKCVI